MNAPTHIAGGMTASAVYLLATNSNLPPYLTLAALSLGAVGGLLPDIDHPSSTISKVLKPISFIVTKITSHRGIFHAPLFYLVLFALTFWICPAKYQIWGNVLFCGIASHLILDFLNSAGIPLFFPLDKEKRNLLRIKTNGAGEMFIRFILYIVCIFLSCICLFPQLLPIISKPVGG